MYDKGWWQLLVKAWEVVVFNPGARTGWGLAHSCMPHATQQRERISARGPAAPSCPPCRSHLPCAPRNTHVPAVMDLERVGVPLLVLTVVAAVSRRWWLPRVQAWWRRRKLKHSPKQNTGLDRDLDV